MYTHSQLFRCLEPGCAIRLCARKTDETLEAVPRDLTVNTAVNQRKQNSERSMSSTTDKHTFCSQIR